MNLNDRDLNTIDDGGTYISGYSITREDTSMTPSSSNIDVAVPASSPSDSTLSSSITNNSNNSSASGLQEALTSEQRKWERIVCQINNDVIGNSTQ